MLTNEDLKKLSAPFPKERLGVKVQALNKERTSAMLVLYLQHTDVMDRLEEVDPAWTSESLEVKALADIVYVRMRMHVKGVSRENVGEGHDPKAAYSDALKRCAVLFGVGRYLYDSETVWVPYNERTDKYKAWTYEEHQRALKPQQEQTPVLKALPTEKEPLPQEKDLKRERCNKRLMALYQPYLRSFPKTNFPDVLYDRYQLNETRLMTVEQLEDLIRYMESQLKMDLK